MISLNILSNFIRKHKINRTKTSETNNEKELPPSYENSIKSNTNSSSKVECPKCQECPKCPSSSINYNNELLEKLSKLIKNKKLNYSNLSNKLSNRIKNLDKNGTTRSSSSRNIINNYSSSNRGNSSPSNNNFESLIEKKKLILKELEDIKVKQLKLIDQRLNKYESK